MLPSNQDWKFMRNESLKFLPDTVSIVSIVTTYDNETGETDTPTVVSTPKAKVYDVSGSERQLLARLVDEGVENIETAKIDLPYGTTITTSHKVLTSDGKYWNVHSTNNSQTYTIYKQALLYRKIVNNQVVD